MAILSLQSVSKEYLTDGQRVRALDGITLEAAEGEFVALVGRSGIGMTDDAQTGHGVRGK